MEGMTKLFNTEYHIQFLWSLLLTIVVETAVLFVLVRRVLKMDQKTLGTETLAATGVITSGATLPYLWFVFPCILHTRVLFLTVSESFAVLAETVIIGLLCRLPLRKAFGLSMVCNMVSFGVGWGIYELRLRFF